MARKSRKKVWIFVVVLFLACIAAGAVLALSLFGTDPLLTYVAIEAGDPVPDASAFRSNPNRKTNVSYADPEAVAAIDTTKIGNYPVELLYKGKTIPAAIAVQDTTPPSAITRDMTAFQLNPPEPEDFLEQVEDYTAVTAAYAAYPDLTNPNPQTVSIVLTDACGNTATVTATLTVEIDTEPPVISGARNIEIYKGDTVSYRSGVTVKDNLDEEPVLEIDAQGVDLNTPGEYSVTYTAIDTSGNTAAKTITVTVLEMKDGYATTDEINEVVDGILSQIISDGMTARQQLRAIYDYVRSHSSYVDHSDKDDWRQAGYRLLTQHSGDCFNFFAAGKLMMERLGIPNIDVVKVKNYPTDSNHYWSLVSIDGGQTYYHFDMTPRNVDLEFFLLTDAQLDDFSESHKNAYNRDKSLYPATPES